MKIFVAIAVACLATLTSQAADPPISSLIDKHLQLDWATRGITPAAVADDAEYLRRVTLDLTGQIPSVAETRAFLADVTKDKRTKLVDRLLQSPEHARHFAAIIRLEWVPANETNFRVSNNVPQFESWLLKQFQDNVSYDSIVTQLITTEVFLGQRGKVDFENNTRVNSAVTPASEVYFGALDTKPEVIAGSVTRLFLGVKLECAQCHDHPFASYTRDQFWEFAAFFSEFSPLSPVSPSFLGPLQPQFDRNRIGIPNTEKILEAKHFDGSTVEWTNDRSPRQEIALWIDGPGRTIFARNAVNRTWARFFGLGIQDPIDEPSDKNPPSHPELLDGLTKVFIANKFNLRELYRGIVLSHAYQLTSKLSHPTQSDPRRFARMNMKGLYGGAVYDSLAKAVGYQPDENERRNYGRPFDGSERAQFLSRFNLMGKTTETPTTILQALTLMNGQFVNVSSPERGTVLAAITDAPFMNNADKVETLFLATLTRMPSPEERDRFTSFVDRGGASNDAQKALADVFWVLLNSTEFLFNH